MTRRWRREGRSFSLSLLQHRARRPPGTTARERDHEIKWGKTLSRGRCETHVNPWLRLHGNTTTRKTTIVQQEVRKKSPSPAALSLPPHVKRIQEHTGPGFYYIATLCICFSFMVMLKDALGSDVALSR